MRSFRKASYLTFMLLIILASRVSAQQEIAGDLAIEGDLHFREFSLLGSGAVEFPNKLRLGRGGEGAGLPPQGNRVRAQPGGNLEILPLGDYFRSALDIYPTMGKKPDMDALAELTIHRMLPSNEGHEMLSVTALANTQQRFGLIVEAHGAGRVKPLDFQVIQGGLLDRDKHLEPFNAIAMRVKTDGTAQFSAERNGGTPGPVDAISVERDSPGSNGDFPSDYVRLTAKRVAETVRPSEWRTNVQLPAADGSSFTLENREAGDEYVKKLTVTSTGELEVATPGAGLILTSPNGKKWRLAVSDHGALTINATE